MENFAGASNTGFASGIATTALEPPPIYILFLVSKTLKTKRTNNNNLYLPQQL